MKRLDTSTNKDSAAKMLDQLAVERKDTLARIACPLGRVAARAGSLVGYGPLALNAKMAHYYSKKLVR